MSGKLVREGLEDEAEKEPAKWGAGGNATRAPVWTLEEASKQEKGGLIWDLRCSGKHLQVWGQGGD